MSLSAFLNSKDFKEAKVKFKTVFPNPKIQVDIPLSAPPLSPNYAIIGHSFDYALRLMLQHKYKRKVICDVELRAERGFAQTINKLGGRYILPKLEGKDLKQVQKDVKQKYRKANDGIRKYMKDGIVTDLYAEALLIYGKFDIVSRCGDIDSVLADELKEDVRDIKTMVDLIKNSDFKVNKKCYLNPTFGEGGGTVGGADADLIIDDTLIDIKATRYLKLQRRDLNQILVYYIMSLIGGINGDKRVKPIKYIGLYFARHGYLWKIPVSSIGDKQFMDELKKWWISYTNEKIWTPIEHGVFPSMRTPHVEYMSERQRALMSESEESK